MARKRVVAERVLLMKDGAATPKKIVIRIGMPYWVQENQEAACPVEIQGLYEHLADIHGVDYYQAIELAIAFVNTLLAKSRSRRREVYWPSGAKYDTVRSPRPPRR